MYQELWAAYFHLDLLRRDAAEATARAKATGPAVEQPDCEMQVSRTPSLALCPRQLAMLRWTALGMVVAGMLAVTVLPVRG
jgi:hypothetical protein